MNIIKAISSARANRKLRLSCRRAHFELENLMKVIHEKGAIPKLYETQSGVQVACGVAISNGLVWGAASTAAVSVFHGRLLLDSHKNNNTVASISHA